MKHEIWGHRNQNDIKSKIHRPLMILTLQESFNLVLQ